MSVLIKGMKMPTSCRPSDCPLTGWACELWKSVNNFGEKKEKHKDCPIIELPDHGDLIDRNMLIGGFADWYIQESPMYLGDNKVVAETIGEAMKAMKAIEAAPVVIPAERSVKVCPLSSDDEVTEYCVEGPCTDEMEGRCPIAERSEE